MGMEIPGRRSKTRLPRATIFCPSGASGNASRQRKEPASDPRPNEINEWPRPTETVGRSAFKVAGVHSTLSVWFRIFDGPHKRTIAFSSAAGTL